MPAYLRAVGGHVCDSRSQTLANKARGNNCGYLIENRSISCELKEMVSTVQVIMPICFCVAGLVRWVLGMQIRAALLDTLEDVTTRFETTKLHNTKERNSSPE
jgi:hypothetical protein